MHSTPRDSTAFARGGYVLSLIVLLSILVPASIACFSIHTAVAGKPFGSPSGESKIYQGPLMGGKLWFNVWTYTGDPALQSNTHCRIKRLDLETGIEQETGFEVDGEDGIYPVELNNELYGISHKAIYQLGVQPMKKILRPARSPGYFPLPFFYEGRLTEIAETNRGGFRLVHWERDHWIDGREILLPGFDRAWWHDPQRDCQVLVPLHCKQPAVDAGAGRLRTIRVLPYKQEFHLFLTDYQKFAAYRKGFEFADQTDENVASGLKPENAATEVSGWEPVCAAKPGTRWGTMECNDSSLQFIGFNNPPIIARRMDDGHWIEIELFDPNSKTNQSQHGHYVLLSNSAESTSYLVEEEQLWGSAVVHRIQGDTIQQPHLTVPGYESAYLKRWQFICVGLLIAWLTHFVVVVVGFDWAIRRTKHSRYEFGMQQARLSSILQRATALMIDGLLIATPLLALAYANNGFEWKMPAEKQLSHQLFQLEQTIDRGIKSGAFSPTSINLWSWGSSLSRLISDRGTMILIAAVLLLLCTLRPFARSWFGMTVGEWLTGIRRVRSTLRPVDFSRALLCEALYCFDILCLATPLPAAISMFVSQNRQRVGDRVADTLVVNAGSIRDIEQDVTPTKHH